jgi:proteasome assembly chaperone 3
MHDTRIPSGPTQPDYPCRTKRVAGIVGGQLTDVTTMLFSDKIMITITQAGKLAQWVSKPDRFPTDICSSKVTQIQVPLESALPGRADRFLAPNLEDDGLLPMSHLTALTLLGGSATDRETIGHLYATHIASSIVMKNPDESRSVLLGLGLSKLDTNREQFFDIMDLVQLAL